MGYTSEAAQSALSTYGNAPTVGPGDEDKAAKKAAKAFKKRNKKAAKGKKNHSSKPTGCRTKIMRGGGGRR